MGSSDDIGKDKKEKKVVVVVAAFEVNKSRLELRNGQVFKILKYDKLFRFL